MSSIPVATERNFSTYASNLCWDENDYQEIDFEMILGFNFIKKHSVSITPSFNSILTKDITIHFIGNHEKGNIS